MNLLSALLFVIAATASLSLAVITVTMHLDGRDARRDAARRNGAHKL